MEVLETKMMDLRESHKEQTEQVMSKHKEMVKGLNQEVSVKENELEVVKA